ncbi:MAG TPA: fibronectin type III domain-containing protein, partial [Fibrobacteria bacterium]|nr:fibronectin type III domain-containing protein [Fibrobacteria bacterium]
MRNATSLILTLAGSIAADPTPTGRWDFEDALFPGAATTGLPLAVRGSVESIEGPSPSDRALRLAKGAQLALAHGRTAPVHSYTVSLDLRITGNGTWRSLFQTDPRNVDDAECFVRPDGAVGVKATGYSSASVFAGAWHRLVVSVDGGSSHRIYLDGRRILDGVPQPAGGRFALSDTLLLFADNDGETDATDLARATFHDHALDSSEVAALGGFASPSSFAFLRAPWLQAATDTSISVFWETSSPENARLEYGVDSTLGHSAESILATSGSSTAIRIARLRDLDAGTTYFFRIVSDTFRSEIRTFRTASSRRSARVRFGIWGDSHRLHPAK